MLSVVVTTHARPALLREQLNALAAQRLAEPWEVIVADNNPAGLGRVVAAEFGDRLDVRHVDASARRGPAAARNIGVSHARGDRVAFLDDDDLVAAGWLPAIADALDRHPVVAARLEHDELNPAWLVKVRGRPQESVFWTWYRMPDAPVAFAGTIAVRRDLHESIGGWDEELPTHEDADYTLRLRRLGHEVRLAPDAVVYLRHRPTLRATFRQALFYGEALPAFYRKHEPLGLPRPPRTAPLKGWLSLARSLVVVHDRATWGVFVWQLGWRVGLVRGSVRHRYLLLSE